VTAGVALGTNSCAEDDEILRDTWEMVSTGHVIWPDSDEERRMELGNLLA
jgi:hypothetical protein